MTFPATDNLPLIHPGEILRDDLEALGLARDGLPSTSVCRQTP